MIIIQKFGSDSTTAIKYTTISQDEISSYRSSLIIKMKKIGASNNDLKLIHDATIRNSIRNNRNPDDVAWAILQ